MHAPMRFVHPPLGRILKDAGYRDTAPRRAMVRAIEEADGDLDPDALWRAGKRFHPGLGRATVYRTLEALTTLGVVRPLVAPDGGRLYSPAVGGHHHLVCSGCGTIVDFHDCAEGAIVRRVARQNNFQIRGHLLEVYGLCGDCGPREATP
jgi:Fur family transcriptional regulator, ferric uptake regulator